MLGLSDRPRPGPAGNDSQHRSVAPPPVASAVQPGELAVAVLLSPVTARAELPSPLAMARLWSLVPPPVQHGPMTGSKAPSSRSPQRYGARLRGQDAWLHNVAPADTMS